MMRRAALTVFLPFLIAAGASGAEFIPLRAAVHVDTSVSHGRRTISIAGIPIMTMEGETPQDMEDIVRIARGQNVDVIILADRARSDVSYGLTPFSRLLKLTVSEGSVAEYGSARYLARVSAVAGRGGVIVIPGVECIPHYRWRGSPFTGLKLEHLYEHMVVAGLDTPEAVDAIPDTAGGYGRRLSWTIIFNVVFLALIVVGVRLWRRRARPRKVIGGVLVVLSLMALVDSAPFLPRKISAYDDPAVSPADVLGGYAESAGALALWAHPSANPGSLANRLKQSTGIAVDVGHYRHVLHDTMNYDGFPMFNAGVEAGEPGREWDRALAQHCAGERERPVWVVSECDFDAESPPDGLSDAQTVVWARERTAAAVLDALRRGRCYATKQKTHRKLVVDRYALADGRTAADSGEELVTAAEAGRLQLTLRTPASSTGVNPWERNLEARIIVGGVDEGVLHPAAGPVADGFASWQVDRAVRFDARKKKSYVRVIVYDSGEAALALNPIFVSREPKE